jgi:hypothetical protein
VEQFFRKFLDGMPEVRVGRSKRAPYAKGFIQRYELHNPFVKVFTAQDGRAESYTVACRRALRFARDGGFQWDLAFIQIEDSFHTLNGDENPYLVTKSAFMKRQVPVQEATIEKMTASAGDLVYIMNDLSLGMYAKLGGTPWLLEADRTIAHEVVIGLGSAHFGASRLGARERIVGITSVFTGDGRYLLDSRTAAVPYRMYRDALLDSLKRAVGKVRDEQNWHVSDDIRIIFHAFKPLKDVEVDAVAKTMSDLGFPNAKFAFLHVKELHPLLLFDCRHEGVRGPLGMKGEMAPLRGTMVMLGKRDALLSLVGSREVKDITHGLPQPVLLTLHRKSTFTDMTYLARQAFAFACHSWRTFSPAPLPITILYSDLMARLLQQLSQVSHWDDDAMLDRIGRTRWFL